MSSCRDRHGRPARRGVAAAAVAAAAATLSAASFAQAPAPRELPGIGRPATAKELAAWDIDVRPDFRGLPAGRGSVAQGQDVWEAKCAGCHGVFGESNSVFNPIVGGTTADDVRRGRAARLDDPGYPARTTLMKLPTVSTLWDYVRRAMPWNAPKTLSTDEVYAVVAYMLNLGGVVPDDFVLSDATIAQTQARLPNRDGMTTDHALWPGRAPLGVDAAGDRGRAAARGAARPDTRSVACMSDCRAEPKVASLLPDFARDSHGDLARQNRLVGGQRGADTARPPGAAPAAAAVAAAPTTAAAPASEHAGVLGLLGRHGCAACHGVEAKLVGPALRDVAAKYAARPDAAAALAAKIRAGGAGVWGPVPMPPQTLPDDDLRAIAGWLAAGAPR